VLLGRDALPASSEAALATQASGWARGADGFVVVKLADRFDAFRISLEP